MLLLAAQVWSWARQLLLLRWKAAVGAVQTLQRQQIELHLNLIYVHEVTFLGLVTRVRRERQPGGGCLKLQTGCGLRGTAAAPG